MQLVWGAQWDTPAVQPWYAAVFRDQLYGWFTAWKGRFSHFPTLQLTVFHSLAQPSRPLLFIPPVSLSLWIMMCRNICVLDCCLSWAVEQAQCSLWLGWFRVMFNQQKLAGDAGCIWHWAYKRTGWSYERSIMLVFYAFWERQRKENSQKQNRAGGTESKQTRLHVPSLPSAPVFDFCWCSSRAALPQ